MLLCLILPFGYTSLIRLFVSGKWLYYIGGFGPNAEFYLLALLPGAVAIIHHVVTRSSRQSEVMNDVERFRCMQQKYLTQCGEVAAVTQQKVDASVLAERENDMRWRALFSSVSSALLLTAVFLFVAAMADRYGILWESGRREAIHGLILAGFGAYVSVVYYMIGRMYANALSSRFVSASMLKTAFAVALGMALGGVGIVDALPTGRTPAVALFLLGLFQSAAYSAIRSRANTWLGAAKPENEELPLDTIQGIDDTTVDLLREYGIATLQQLAEADPAECSLRSLVPIATLCDWIDQAIFIVEVQRKISATRPLGVRAATDVVCLYLREQTGDQDAGTILSLAGQKTDLGENGIRQVAKKFENSPIVSAILEFLRTSKVVLLTDSDFDVRFNRRMSGWVVAKSDDVKSDLKLLPIAKAKEPPQPNA